MKSLTGAHWARGLLLAVSVIASTSASAAESTAISLTPGVIVDTQDAAVYLPDPSGHAKAVNMLDGRIAWTSTERAFPLMLRDNKLLALGVVEQFGFGMVLLLDPVNGAVLDRIAFDLPESVSADFLPQPNREFVVSTEPTSSGARLFWRFQSRPLQGALMVNADGEPEINVKDLSGALDIVLTGERAYARHLQRAVSPPRVLPPELTASERLREVQGRQFRGADDTALLATRAVDHPTLGSINQWSFHDRRSGKLLGSLESLYSAAPFVLADKTLIYRAAASGQMDAAGQWLEQPTRLVGYSLGSARELWATPLLDQTYRGVMPP